MPSCLIHFRHEHGSHIAQGCFVDLHGFLYCSEAQNPQQLPKQTRNVRTPLNPEPYQKSVELLYNGAFSEIQRLIFLDSNLERHAVESLRASDDIGMDLLGPFTHWRKKGLCDYRECIRFWGMRNSGVIPFVTTCRGSP